LTENIGNIYSPEISPNGKRVVFTVKNDGIHSIWIMKRDGSNARPVSPANYSGFDPTWSPENDRIAFVSDLTDSPQLYIVHAGAEKIRQVTNGVQAIGEYVSWSPDGKGLAFVAGTIGNRQIFIVGIDGGDMRQLTNVGDNIAPSFSPDGQWITFTSNKAGSDDIYIMRMDGSEITRLSGREEADRQPGWGS
jgi:TolB protein